MLLAIFTLLLLTAMGLSLLCAADLETNIAANYRDKQVSLYSALSGLQEARDRLIPSRCATDIGNDCNDSIAVDTRSMGLPTLGDPNGVLYIINPSNGETVKPLARVRRAALRSPAGRTGSTTVRSTAQRITIARQRPASTSPWPAACCPLRSPTSGCGSPSRPTI